MRKFNVINKVVAGFLALTFHMGASATTYTQNTQLSDFTSGVSEYATFISAGTTWTNEVPIGSAPTASTILDGKRVVGDGNTNPIVVSFSNAVSNIRVFANMDHLGASYDGYQYSIYGSNDNQSYTLLFDALSVNGSGEPFTLGSFDGIAPTRVNNIVTGNTTSGATGYIADFDFGAESAYKYYKFGVSTFAASEGNADQELSAVAAVPEPETYAMMMAGLGVMGAVARRRKQNTSN